MVAEVTLELKHNMEVQEVHTVEVLVPIRNLCDSPNYGCKYYHMMNSPIGFYSPSWTYIYLDFSPQVADFAIQGFYSPSLSCMLLGYPLPHADRTVPLPLGSNLTLIYNL